MLSPDHSFHDLVTIKLTTELNPKDHILLYSQAFHMQNLSQHPNMLI